VADEEILGVDRHVRLQLAFPPTLGVLEREQAVAATFEREARSVERR